MLAAVAGQEGTLGTGAAAEPCAAPLSRPASGQDTAALRAAALAPLSAGPARRAGSVGRSRRVPADVRSQRRTLRNCSGVQPCKAGNCGGGKTRGSKLWEKVVFSEDMKERRDRKLEEWYSCTKKKKKKCVLLFFFLRAAKVDNESN